MKPDQFVYGTQYYRYPTPLPEEWEQDIEKFDSLGLDVFQIRVQWRKCEPAEGRYVFDDVDRLLELAKKYNRKAIVKFMLETAPQYVFEKYDAERRGFDGLPIRASTHGAYYIGGWWPCFENPGVIAAATRFIRVCVQRYAGNPDILLWNAWNEPCSRPVGDCACEHSMGQFRQWLRAEYGSIEAFNSIWGASEESFETIPVPGMPAGYWDFFLFRKWRSTAALQDRLKWVYDTIRECDKTRIIMTHAGASSCIQEHYNYGGDDFSMAKSVDLYGTSYPVPHHLKTHRDELSCGLIADFLRHIDKNFFVHELYPDWGNWLEPVTVEDLRYKIWTVLSRGAKGLMFWQYRAERVGNENNLAGLVHMDGSFNRRTVEAGAIGRLIRENQALFSKLEVAPSEVAIVYDFDSALISQVEDESQKLFDFSVSEDALFNHNRALKGWYNLFSDMSIPVDFIDTRDLSALESYKVVCLPYLSIVRTDVAAALTRFVENGGILLADEGFALRQDNTWLSPVSPGGTASTLTPAKWINRIKCDGTEKVRLADGGVSVVPYRTVYQSPEGAVLARYGDGSPAIQEFRTGNGRTALFGCPAGYSYFSHSETAWLDWFTCYLADAGLRKNPVEDVKKELSSRELLSGDTRVLVVFNRSKDARTIQLPWCDGGVRELTTACTMDERAKAATIPAGQVGCFVFDR